MGGSAACGSSLFFRSGGLANLIENPWTTLNSKQIYDNPWITVREDEVIKPSGGAGIYGVVSFKNLAIGIIPVDEQGQTWLVGQYRYALESYSWEIPMGGGPLGIDPLASARRELREETGLEARRWQKILTVHTSNSVTDELGYVYLARDLSQHAPDFDDTEVLQVKKLPLAEAAGLVLRGEITDSLSVGGLLAAQRLLNLG